LFGEECGLELAKFIFLSGIKTLGLLFLGLLASKAVGALQSPRTPALRWGLYALILAAVVLGALAVGEDVAAETSMRASGRDLARGDGGRALVNAQRAVELRPATLRYWQTLSSIKFAQKQYTSTVADAPALRALAGGKLEEADAYRIAVSHFLLGDCGKVHPLTETLIRDNPAYAAPRVLEGYTLLSEKHYDQASKTFLEVLRMYPSQQSAVEGLAHAQYLSGNRASALSVLEQTARYPFAPEARRRFEDLKGLYALE
jgi:tetratricopeptide (TPR) repeat protein